MSVKSKSKGKEQQPKEKGDDYRAFLTEGILRPATSVSTATDENLASFQILPEYLQKWAASSDQLPAISDLSLPNIYPILASALGVDDYQYNMLSFWFVDILGEAIRIAQDELQLSMSSQKRMVAWFVNILRAIKERNLSRDEIYAQVHLTIVTAEGHSPYTALGVPSPAGSTKDEPEVPRRGVSTAPRPTRNLQSVEMYSIAGLLWHIFANPFQYEIIKKAFCDAPPVQDINIPYELNQPKTYKPPPVPEKKVVTKKASDKKKGKTEEEEHTEQERLEMLEKIEREKNLYILPLREAVDDNYFINLFNVEIVPETPKKKERNGKKK
ncbi:uncharacterized protein LOC126353825 [Schistocerca gregaria]|uniref:uncharacterized protein LOC126353825 n=1 Tax=Schistocerca gregaria TaxID=7010 RepID=UPI00211DE2D6|nr:uncharacterized protein LOC126353825 [Schistocerca gregaria]